jgi:hypothetical protein
VDTKSDVCVYRHDEMLSNDLNGRTEQDKTGPGRAEQDRAGQERVILVVVSCHVSR